MIGAMVYEVKALIEAYTLDLLEVIARITYAAKFVLQVFVLPALHWYQRLVRYLPPFSATFKARRAASAIAKHNRTTGNLYPPWPVLQLPTLEENGNLGNMPRSQLVRASTPWIQRWRVPFFQFGDNALLLSRFKLHYWLRTDEYTLTLAQRMKQRAGLNLPILRGVDLESSDKGQESWTRADDSATAGRLFCVLAFARHAALRRATPVVFRQTNPDGLVGYAQAMIYNANPQRPNPGGGMQPCVGFDTLNWLEPVLDYSNPPDDGSNRPIPFVPEPLVRINWQAKLVPTTRLGEALLVQTGQTGKVIRRTWAGLPLSHSH
jgi:hypothetical protein